MDHWKCVVAIFLQFLANGAVIVDLTKEFNVFCQHTQFCNRNSTADSDKNRTVPSCCSSCSCEPRCQFSRDCCPDAPISTVQDEMQNQDFKCLPLEDMLSTYLKPNKLQMLKPHYLTIQSCRDDYFNATHVDGCLAEQFSRLVDYIPVVDWRSFKLYRNFHCAICNNITDPVAWQLESTCLALYKWNNLPAMVDELRSAIRSCDVLFKPPAYLQQKFHLCRTDSYADVIKSCNQSGQWDAYDDAYDDDLSEVCNMKSFVSYFIAQQQKTPQESDIVVYKNYACFLCNTNESMRENISCPAENQMDEKSELSTFMVTVNLDRFVYIEMKPDDLKTIQSSDNGKVTKPSQACGFGRYMDPYKNVCREMRCPIDQYAIEGLCLTKSAEVDHLAVAVKLAVTILQAPSTEYITDSSARKFVQSFNHTVNEQLFNSCEIHRSVITIFPNSSVDEVLVSVTVVTDTGCSVSYLFDILKQLDPDTGQPFRVIGEEFRYDIGITYANYIQNDGLYLEIVNGSVTEAIDLSRLFHCPRVVLTALEYKHAVESGVFEYTHDSDYKIKQVDSKTVEVCISDYEHKYLDGLYLTELKTVGYSVLTIISAVCTVLSMICLIITLITFAIFKDLRFMPGKMFVMLCVNVLIAQLLFQFGMGVGGYGPLCVALGIIVHYLWLAVAFSMNSCILLMYNHFHCPLKISTRSAVLTQRNAKVEMGKYAAYTYSCPLIFVLANIIMSLIISKNKSMGYGGQFCYIDTRLMRGLVFALPLGVIILVNFGLFSRVLYDIMKIKVEHLKAESDNICSQFVIFLKFSTITGIYWSFGFFYEITELECFGYIYVLLNAGQGIFLMASFLFNRKVLNLYKGLCVNYAERFKSKTTNSKAREDKEMIVAQETET